MASIEASVLPDEQKKLLCLELLNEFGVTKWQTSTSGELRHRCTLPFGGHRNNDNPISASVNFKTLQFNCFVCGHGGSLAWWIAANRGLQMDQVEGWIASKTGLGGRSIDLKLALEIIDAIVHPPSNKPEPLPFFNEKILDRWNDWGMFHPYLTEERGISEYTLGRYKVGYADDDEDFHYFRRIVIPVFWKGNLVGWQARRTDTRDPNYKAKYQNSPGFPRDRVLYGETQEWNIVLVESPMSVLKHAHHQPIVSTLGAKVTDAQLRLLHRYRQITLWYDNDSAGYKATMRIIQQLSRFVRLSVVNNPFADVDPGDLEENEFKEIMKDTVPGALWRPKRHEELITI